MKDGKLFNHLNVGELAGFLPLRLFKNRGIRLLAISTAQHAEWKLNEIKITFS